jgi:hypothetical protein
MTKSFTKSKYRERGTARNNPYYKYFSNMIQRAKANRIECAFSFGQADLDRFIDIIGPIPMNMVSPTVGRYDHLKGYIFDGEKDRWNFRWQEMIENSAESYLSGLKIELETRTESQRKDYASKGGLASGKSPNRITSTTKTCPHCGVTSTNGLSMINHHFDRCKMRR